MIYVILGLTKFKLISSLFTIFLLNKGFSFYMIALGTSIFHITGCIMEIPLGIFIDKFGTKVSLILNNVLYILKVILFFTTNCALGLFTMYFIRSINKSLSKKCDVVVIGNILEVEKKSDKFSNIYGNLVAINSGFLVLSSVICGFFFDNYLVYILLATVILHLISSVITIFFYKEPKHQQIINTEDKFINRFVDGFKFIKDNKLFKMFMLFSIITLVRIVIVDMKSVLMKELNTSTWFISLISIIGETNQAITGKVSHKIINKFKNYTLFILIGFLFVFSSIPIISDSSLIVLMYCFTPIFNGLKSVFSVSEMNKITSSNNKGTVLSFLYVIEAVLSAIVMAFIGKLQNSCGTVSVFICTAIFIIVVLIPLSINYIKNDKIKNLSLVK